jgi:plastocyanin
MAIERQILIKPNAPGISPRVVFDPNPLAANTMDQIFWTNNDSQPHWPGRLNGDGTIDTTFFMPNQIAPNGDVSSVFSTVVKTDATHQLNYACSLHPAEQGSITIS